MLEDKKLEVHISAVTRKGDTRVSAGIFVNFRCEMVHTCNKMQSVVNDDQYNLPAFLDSRPSSCATTSP